MRLTSSQVEIIRDTIHQVVGEEARITLFGSRVHDSLRGGDVDLMIEVFENVTEPALLSARMASRVSRAMNGRKVDVVLKAPNLIVQPIHEIAEQSGVQL